MDAGISGLSGIVGGDSKDEIKKTTSVIEANVERFKIIAKMVLYLAFSTLDMMIKQT